MNNLSSLPLSSISAPRKGQDFCLGFLINLACAASAIFFAASFFKLGWDAAAFSILAGIAVPIVVVVMAYALTPSNRKFIAHGTLPMLIHGLVLGFLL